MGIAQLSSGDGVAHVRGTGDKKVKGRKRHIVTDTGGLLVGAPVHPADIRDRDGAPALPVSLRYRFPWLRRIFADGAYAAPKLKAALKEEGQWSGRQRGRTATGGWPGTSRRLSLRPGHGSYPEAPKSCCEGRRTGKNNGIFRNGR